MRNSVLPCKDTAMTSSSCLPGVDFGTNFGVSGRHDDHFRVDFVNFQSQGMVQFKWQMAHKFRLRERVPKPPLPHQIEAGKAFASSNLRGSGIRGNHHDVTQTYPCLPLDCGTNLWPWCSTGWCWNLLVSGRGGVASDVTVLASSLMS